MDVARRRQRTKNVATLDLVLLVPPNGARVSPRVQVAGILGLSPWDSPFADVARHGKHPVPPTATTPTPRPAATTFGPGASHGGPTRTRTDPSGTGHVHPRGLGCRPRRAPTSDGDDLVLVDAKTAATDDHWTDTEPPAYYVVASSLWRSHAVPTRAACTWLCCSVGRDCRSAEYVIERDDALITGLIGECRTFYDTVEGRSGAGTVRHGVRLRRDPHRPSRHRPRRRGRPPDDLVTDFLTDAAHEKRAPVTKAAILAAMGTARLAKSSTADHRPPPTQRATPSPSCASPTPSTLTQPPERPAA